MHSSGARHDEVGRKLGDPLAISVPRNVSSVGDTVAMQIANRKVAYRTDAVAISIVYLYLPWTVVCKCIEVMQDRFPSDEMSRRMTTWRVNDKGRSSIYLLVYSYSLL